jgi:hypothetical protein
MWHARELLDETDVVIGPPTQSGEITGIATMPEKWRRTEVLVVSHRSDDMLATDRRL